jgi:hypothetical protein
MTITLTDAEMAELAEHTRKWMSDAHATAKQTERDALAARRLFRITAARAAFDEAMRNVSPTDADAINNYIRAIKS